MKLRNTRLWVVLLVVAFLVLWVVSVGVTYAAPVQEPLPEPAVLPPASQIRMIGVMGWGIVALGCFGVTVTVFSSFARPRKRRRPVRNPNVSYESRRPARTVYGTSKYGRTVERRW